MILGFFLHYTQILKKKKLQMEIIHTKIFPQKGVYLVLKVKFGRFTLEFKRYTLLK